MPLRIHELHPSLVHYPLALFPTAIGADLLGKLTRSQWLMKMGARLMPIAAGSAAVTGAAGLVAQQAVRAEGPAHDILVTHRNMNLGLIAIGAAMAVLRNRSSEPSAGYLLAGIGAVAAMTFTAYLGGKMVYDHGVGVRPAHGVHDAEAPDLLDRRTVREAVRKSAQHAVRGARHIVGDARRGEIAPALRQKAVTPGP